MFYPVSKMLWIVADPANLLIIIACIGLVVTASAWRRTGRALVACAVLAIVMIAVLPIGQILLAALETRFPAWQDDGGTIDGIVVLGGVVDPDIYARHQGSGLNSAIGRITEAARLAHRFKAARIIFAGGSVTPGSGAPSEAEAAREIFAALGIGDTRLTLDLLSRNTFENAYYARLIAQPKPGERWLVVTSAFHMARAMGSFRAVDFPVLPYPVDYRAAGFPRNPPSVVTGMTFVSIAMHEITGLIAYRLTNRTHELFPGPQD